MATKFTFYEIVRIMADSPRIRRSIANKEGIIVGMNEPDELNKRDYGVHINDYGRTFAIAEDLLESTGRFESRENIVSSDTRSRKKR